MSTLTQQRHGARASGASSAVGAGLVVYSGAVVLAAALVCGFLPRAGLLTEWPVLLTLIGLAALVGSRSVKVETLRIEVTASDAFTFFGLLAIGPLAAPIVALAGTVGSVIASGHLKRRRLQAIFNMAAITLSAAISAWIHHAILASEQLGSYSFVVAVGAAGITFGLVNTVLVALVMRIATGAPVFSNWCGFGPWAVGSSMGSLLIALGLFSLIPTVGFAGLILGFFGTRLITDSTQVFRDRTKNTTQLATT